MRAVAYPELDLLASHGTGAVARGVVLLVHTPFRRAGGGVGPNARAIIHLCDGHARRAGKTIEFINLGVTVVCLSVAPFVMVENHHIVAILLPRRGFVCRGSGIPAALLGVHFVAVTIHFGNASRSWIIKERARIVLRILAVRIIEIVLIHVVALHGILGVNRFACLVKTLRRGRATTRFTT
jgi:hypothetical protein